MNIRQLQYFLAIAENGTISEAAKKLGISQPPLSMQLRLLEEEAGVQLVERGPRKIHLTDAGKLLYQRADTLVSLSESTLRELRAFESGTRGTLRLGMISSCGAVLLEEKMLPAFCGSFPQISFEIHEGNTYELLELLQSDVIEVAVLRTPFPEEGVECIPLEEEPMVAAAPKGTFAELPEAAVTVEQLSSRPLIYYRRMEGLLEESFRQAGVSPRVVCKNEDARTSLMWAQAGMGTALVPRSIFRAVDHEDMEYRVIAAPALVTQMAAVCRNSGYRSPQAKELLAFLRQTRQESGIK